MNLSDKAKKLPSSPGVYLMKDSLGGIIYVGKSKNLRSRVQSYFQNQKNHSRKVEKLVHHLKDFDTISTDTEFEAFMLECKLIKEIQPLYNKLMKTPQAYAYIRIDKEQRITVTNEINENESNLFFGPYTSSKLAEKAIQGLKEFYKIDCNHPVQKNTPCLNHSLGLCIGMCFESSAKELYKQIINKIICLLKGNDIVVLEQMKQQMLLASENFEFEKATKIRDTIDSIQSLLKKEKVIEFTKANRNIVIIEPVQERVRKLFLVKGNKVLFSGVAELDEQLGEWIKEKIMTYFNRKTNSLLTYIKKEDIDEAQIIYSYLKSNSCQYLIIPEKWLSAKQHHRIDTALNKLLNNYLKKKD
jgi:excinuclease ABC subunit C